MPLTKCTANQYESAPPVVKDGVVVGAWVPAIGDTPGPGSRAAQAILTAPTSLQSAGDRACKPHAEKCVAGTWLVQAGTATSDIMCEPVSTCGAGSYQSKAATGFSDTVCAGL